MFTDYMIYMYEKATAYMYCYSETKGRTKDRMNKRTKGSTDLRSEFQDSPHTRHVLRNHRLPWSDRSLVLHHTLSLPEAAPAPLSSRIDGPR